MPQYRGRIERRVRRVENENMNRKFLDELYRKLGIIQADRAGLREIKNFPADGCDHSNHKKEQAGLATQESLLNEIIDDYLNWHSA
jgi:hypothetical protein